MRQITYAALPRGDANWMRDVLELVEQAGISTVADLGAGAHPVLAPEYVERRKLDYTIFDISQAEMEKAGEAYNSVVEDVTSPGFADGRRFDLVLSRWLLEHISDPAQFHRNVFEMLPPGGRAVHFFPTLYTLPFMINRVLPERLSGRLLGTSLGETRSKFPARYRWCRGPTRSQLRRLEGTGFEIERYVGYYGHPYYRRIPPLDAAERWRASLLARHPLPLLTNYASVTLRKPALSSSRSVNSTPS